MDNFSKTGRAVGRALRQSLAVRRDAPRGEMRAWATVASTIADAMELPDLSGPRMAFLQGVGYGLWQVEDTNAARGVETETLPDGHTVSIADDTLIIGTRATIECVLSLQAAGELLAYLISNELRIDALLDARDVVE